MTIRILVMGLPGAGKTTFSQELVKRLNLVHTVSWYNADQVREMYNDWDFSSAGRKRQVDRMRELSLKSSSEYVICDFVCPTEELRNEFNADIVIWLDTIEYGRFEDTNRLFVPPKKYTYRITDWSDNWVKSITSDLLKQLLSDHWWRSVVKAYSYRMCGSLTTVLISFFVTGSIVLSATIGVTELLLKPFVYWLHERVWNKIKWGRR